MFSKVDVSPLQILLNPNKGFVKDPYTELQVTVFTLCSCPCTHEIHDICTQITDKLLWGINAGFFQSDVPQEGFSLLLVEVNSTDRKDRGEGRWNVSPTSPKRRAILWAAAFLCSPRRWRSSLWCGIHKESWQLLPQGRRRKQRQRIIHAGPRYCRYFKMCWKVACLYRETEFWCYQLPAVPRRWPLSLSLAIPNQEREVLNPNQGMGRAPCWAEDTLIILD